MTSAASSTSGAGYVIAALLEARTGQQIGANRAWRIDTAVKPLLRDHGLASLDELAVALARSENAGLADAVVEALLNQETSFFRDAGVIELAADFVRSRHRSGHRARIWSVGCATGQEPLSLAMLLAERQPQGEIAPDIIATDISRRALDRARTGRFTQFEVQRGLPIRRMVQWFQQAEEDWVIDPALNGRVQYRAHNLAADPPPPGRFDLILCRNVLFYFAPAVRRAALDRMADALRPGGALLLGAGETVIGQTELLRPSQQWRGLYEPAAAPRSVQIAGTG